MMQYNHMTAALQVKTGDTVEQGQILGTMGSTGYSTGAHLHFGIQRSNGEWIDPEPYLYADYLEDEMNYEKFCEYMARYEAEINAKPAGYAQETWDRLTHAKILDDTRPCAPVERRELGLVIERLGLVARGV